MGNDLKLECVAIGSMPHINLDEAWSIIGENFYNIPFWPQMVKISKNEDMIVQFVEGMPSFFADMSFLDVDYDTFYEDLETFFSDYETILSKDVGYIDVLEKYAISSEKSCAFSIFSDFIRNFSPKYAKGQIVGPFTLTTTFVDRDGKCVIYDDTLRDIVVKTLAIKAVWQIEKMKEVNPSIVPIIFIDEPSMSQLGTSAYVSISEDLVIDMIREISDVIKDFGGISAVHCCGKCDWSIPIRSGVRMINFDAYSFAENISIYSSCINEFLKNGGQLVWGIVPTLDKGALQSLNISELERKFLCGIRYLTDKNIDEKLIINNSLISPSCGAGSLDIELANKAFSLTKELSDRLKERYNDI